MVRSARSAGDAARRVVHARGRPRLVDDARRAARRLGGHAGCTPRSLPARQQRGDRTHQAARAGAGQADDQRLHRRLPPPARPRADDERRRSLPPVPPRPAPLPRHAGGCAGHHHAGRRHQPHRTHRRSTRAAGQQQRQQQWQQRLQRADGAGQHRGTGEGDRRRRRRHHHALRVQAPARRHAGQPPPQRDWRRR